MWIALEALVGLALVVFWISQVVWPVVMGIKLFPMFRRSQKLHDGMVEARQILYEQNLERDLEKLKKETEHEDR